MNKYLFYVPLVLALFSEISLANLNNGSKEILLKYEDLPQYLNRQNLKMQAQQLSIQSAENKKGHLERSFLPSINLEAGGEVFNTEEAGTKARPFMGAKMDVNLFRGNRDKIRNEIFNENVNLEKEEMSGINQKELERARIIFWNLVYNHEHLKLYRETFNKTEGILKSAKKRIEGGLATKTDQLEISLFLEKLQQEMDEILLQEKAFKSKMKVALGTTDKIQLDQSTSLPNPDLVDIDKFKISEKFIADEHREIKSLRSKEKILNLDKDLSDNKKLPTVDLYTEYLIPTNRDERVSPFSDRREVAAGIKVSWNIYDGNKANVDAVSKSLEKASISKLAELKKIELESEYNQLLEEIKMQKKQIDRTKKNLDLAERFMDSAFSEYGRGVKGSLEVLEASEKLYDLKHDLLKQKANFQITMSKIDSIFGR